MTALASGPTGWVQFDQATRFSTEETRSLPLPVSIGRDARFVSGREAQQHYG